MTLFQGLYARNQRQLPADFARDFGSVWDCRGQDDNRQRAFKALQVATLSGLHRALRNGSVWIEHSLAFRGRERLFIPHSAGKMSVARTTDGSGCHSMPRSFSSP